MALIDFVHKASFLIGISTESVETQHRISRESAKINRHAADTQHRLRRDSVQNQQKSAEVSRQSAGIKAQNQNRIRTDSAENQHKIMSQKNCHSYEKSDVKRIQF